MSEHLELEYRIKDLERQVKEMKENKVDRMEFKPIYLIVMGLAGAVLMAFCAALINLVIK